MILTKDYAISKRNFSLQFLPKKIENLSSCKFINYKQFKLKSSYIIDIVHTLLLKYYFKKENSFNLSSLILKDRYGHIYNQYINYLVDNNILLLIKNYQKGKNARIYKLSDDILINDIKRYQNYDKFLLKKYKSSILIDDYILDTKINNQVREKLIQDLYSVTIDYDKSLALLDDIDEIDTFNRNKYSIDCINTKQIFYNFDSYGRFHTNFTILRSGIRKSCLLIDNDETYEKDICNSQPLFLYKLIKDNDVLIVDKEELSLFKKITMNGDFYEYLITHANLNSKIEAKEMTYKVLFGRNYNSKFDKKFRILFPSIYNFIKVYKREMGDYRYLSYNLQRAESNLIFNKVIMRLMNLYPQIKIITVHDSIISSSKYKDIIDIVFNQIIDEEFNKLDN